jgi:hypothetical protein
VEHTVLSKINTYQIDLRGAHFDVVYSLRQQGILRSIVADFSPCGRKIGNRRVVAMRFADRAILYRIGAVELPQVL